MLLVAASNGAFKSVLLIHVIAAFISMAPIVVHPLLFSLEKGRSDSDPVALAKRITGLPTRIYTIALVVAGVLGMGLISMSENVIGWGDSWVSLSLLVWIAMNGIYHGMMLPAEKAIAGGDTSAMAKHAKFSTVLAALGVVIIYLMVIQPGA